jgi:hypothetical protein
MTKLRRIIVGLAAVGFLSATQTALAEEAKEPSKSIDERVSDLEKNLGLLTGFGLSGMAYGSYLWNFNDPDSRKNSLRSLDVEDNSMTLDLFQLGITKTGPAGIAFASKLDFGKTASRIGADWNGNGKFEGVTGDGGDFEIEEAYLTYTPEWAKGGSAKLGKFVTLLGAEVIEAPLNMNYSRSFLFGFAIPFTNTGVLFTAPFSDQFSATIGAVNGWDNVVDNNNGKSVMGNVTWTASPQFSLLFNGIYGPEKTDTDSGPRGVIDVVSNITLDPISISLNGDYGEEGEAALDGGTAKWYGFSGIVGAKLNDQIGLPLGTYVRGEVFDDDGGARTGTNQTLWEVTFTGKWFASEKLTFWVEYRHDGSNEDTFAKNGSIVVVDPTTAQQSSVPKVQDYQDTISVAASYVF